MTAEEVIDALPPLARDESAMGAVIFTRLFFDLQPRIFDSVRDAVLFAHLSHPECSICVDWVSSSNAARESQVTMQGGSITWDDLATPRTVGEGNDGFWYVEERAHIAEVITYDRDGNEESRASAEDLTLYAQVIFEDGHWLMHGIDVVVEGAE